MIKPHIGFEYYLWKSIAATLEGWNGMNLKKTIITDYKSKFFGVSLGLNMQLILVAKVSLFSCYYRCNLSF
ncbi:MAG: hypothetical protein ACOYOA_14260 [Saprospiraceae bacterium]